MRDGIGDGSPRLLFVPRFSQALKLAPEYLPALMITTTLLLGGIGVHIVPRWSDAVSAACMLSTGLFLAISCDPRAMLGTLSASLVTYSLLAVTTPAMCWLGRQCCGPRGWPLPGLLLLAAMLAGFGSLVELLMLLSLGARASQRASHLRRAVVG